jgi:hypothetical protein
MHKFALRADNLTLARPNEQEVLAATPTNWSGIHKSARPRHCGWAYWFRTASWANWRELTPAKAGSHQFASTLAASVFRKGSAKGSSATLECSASADRKDQGSAEQEDEISDAKEAEARLIGKPGQACVRRGGMPHGAYRAQVGRHPDHGHGSGIGVGD